MRKPKVFYLLFSIFHFFICSLQGHQLDEYLQSTLINIDREKITLSINLTPGASITEKLLPHIDANHDETISTVEGQSYCEQFKSNLIVTIDDQPTILKSEDLNFPDYADLTNGTGIIQLTYSIETKLSSREHKLTFENHHMPNIGTYLVNAAQPNSKSIQILTQHRNETQSTSTINFKVAPTTAQKIITALAFTGIWASMFALVWKKQKRKPRGRVTAPS